MAIHGGGDIPKAIKAATANISPRARGKLARNDKTLFVNLFRTTPPVFFGRESAAGGGGGAAPFSFSSDKDGAAPGITTLFLVVSLEDWDVSLQEIVEYKHLWLMMRLQVRELGILRRWVWGFNGLRVRRVSIAEE